MHVNSTLLLIWGYFHSASNIELKNSLLPKTRSEKYVKEWNQSQQKLTLELTPELVS